MDGWNTGVLLGWPIFRCYVSFREGIFCIVQGLPSLTGPHPKNSKREQSQVCGHKISMHRSDLAMRTMTDFLEVRVLEYCGEVLEVVVVVVVVVVVECLFLGFSCVVTIVNSFAAV